MADDKTIIEGTVKFRDGKKWKSRWCVMRRLSPVADCVHLQLYREARARWSGAGCKASLSLQHYLGCEVGFTLDKHSNTLALVCRDFVAVLAFETRERLIQWQVKVCAQLGSARQYTVLVGGGGGAVRAGPARLLLLGRRAALTAGVPPRLLGLWELHHLRRYGVVEGRFCFEGGSLCGKGEGLHVLITDQAKDLAHDFDLASQGRLSPKRRPFNYKKNDGTDSLTRQKAYQPNMRLSELNTIDRSLPPMDSRLYEDPCTGEEAAAISPYWPSTERIQFQDMGLGDTASVNETTEGTDMAPWSGPGNVTLERCMSCMSKLGALSRSSTAALTPGAKHFNPAWTMESVQETTFKISYNNDTVSATDNPEEFNRYHERPPERPPKPTSLELNLDRTRAIPFSVQTCDCSSRTTKPESSTKLGPYENYDVPKLPSAEIEGEYYDTPKRLKDSLNNELFQITKSSTTNAVILKKPCGCLLRFGKRRKHPIVVDTEETTRPTGCPCRRVTDWANNWIKLPYCRRNAASTDNLALNKENLTPDALYATIDLSRKTKRKIPLDDAREVEVATDSDTRKGIDSRTAEIDEGPLANYENLNFALSLEHYENAKDLLLSAGVTRVELDAIRDNLKLHGVSSRTATACATCGGTVPRAPPRTRRAPCADDYLMIEPSSIENNKLERSRLPPAGYTPMSPLSGFALQATSPGASRLLDEKSASNPALGAPGSGLAEGRHSREPRTRADRRKRSSSADSSRFLEDGDESEGGRSSAETLRGVATAGGGSRPANDCGCMPDKHSDADSSEASKGCIGAGVPGNRDSSSSNDSGVSSCSTRRGAANPEFELSARTCIARRHYRSAGRRAPPARRSRSTDPLGAERGGTRDTKSSSAEAEVPVLPTRPPRGVADTHSTSSGTSDMSDYIETLSICSSHSSTDTPVTMRVVRQTTSTLRPRSGNEYQNVDVRLTGPCRAGACPRVLRPERR